MYDLLTPDPTELKYDKHATSVQVPSADKLYALLKKGMQRRKTASTSSNDESSRSHAIMAITVTVKRHRPSAMGLSGAPAAAESAVASDSMSGESSLAGSAADGSSCSGDGGDDRKCETDQETRDHQHSSVGSAGGTQFEQFSATLYMADLTGSENVQDNTERQQVRLQRFEVGSLRPHGVHVVT